jgi:NADH:ubiquinone oxidoreductase subunit 6 (subunit J)
MTLPYNLNRALAAVLLLALLFLGANYYLALGFFGPHAKLLMVLVLAIVVIYSALLMPTRQEMRGHREANRGAKGGRKGA